MDTVIKTRGLSKTFGRVKAVEEVNLEVRKGEIYGFLGRNGAGKTTTIRILLGLIRPSVGEVELLGLPFPARRKEILDKVGYFVEGPAAYPNLTVLENLDMARRLRACPRSKVDEVIGLLGLEAMAHRRAGHLSLGNRQRLSLARSLLHAPDLLILDEPANGLDPAGIIEIRQLLSRLAREGGTTIFMSSHILGEVGQLADRIGIIHGGHLVEELDRDALKKAGHRHIDLTLAPGSAGTGGGTEAAAALLGARLGLRGLEILGTGRLRVTDPLAEAPAIAACLVGGGFGLECLLPVEEGLEEHFMRLTGD